MIKVEHIYDSYDMPEFYRILVDRVWPRGVSKEKARLYLWAKEIAPSTELRKWYNHENDKWDEFKESYLEELKKNPYTSEFAKEVKAHKNVVLLYGAKDKEHNQAVVLKEYLDNSLSV